MEVGCHVVRRTWTIVSPVNEIDTDSDVVTLRDTVQPIMTSLKSEGTENGCFTIVVRVVFVLVVRKQCAAYYVPFRKSGLSYPQRVGNKEQKNTRVAMYVTSRSGAETEHSTSQHVSANFLAVLQSGQSVPT
jgi:hypothetical protein